jgi:excinuclease UvrABC nuclease subunit
MYYEMGQCGAPCNHTVTQKQYAGEVKKVDRFLTSRDDESAVKYLENEMTAEAEMLEFEKASYLRDQINDLKKVLLNIELTNSIVEMQNYIIRCRDDNTKNSWEIFLMVNGKIAKTFSVDLSAEYDDGFVNNITEEINYLYFNGTLFRDYVFSKSLHKFKIDEIDTLRIITNWVYRNYIPSRILKLTVKSNINDVMKFIFKSR